VDAAKGRADPATAEDSLIQAGPAGKGCGRRKVLTTAVTAAGAVGAGALIAPCRLR
jgi:hypothetical protein